jgi:hypothetical protein
MTGSAHDGEALSAIRKANALMREAHVDWNDLLEPFDQLQVAIAAAQVLVAENTALRDAAAPQPGAPPTGPGDWQFVNAGMGTPSEQAGWAIALNAAQGLSLTDLEYDFMKTVSERQGELTTQEKQIFDRLIAKYCESARQCPP